MCTWVPDNKYTIVLVGGGKHLTSWSMLPSSIIVNDLYLTFYERIVDCQHVTLRPCRLGLCRNTAAEQLRGSNHHGDQRLFAPI